MDMHCVSLMLCSDHLDDLNSDNIHTERLFFFLTVLGIICYATNPFLVSWILCFSHLRKLSPILCEKSRDRRLANNQFFSPDKLATSQSIWVSLHWCLCSRIFAVVVFCLHAYTTARLPSTCCFSAAVTQLWSCFVFKSEIVTGLDSECVVSMWISVYIYSNIFDIFVDFIR